MKTPLGNVKVKIISPQCEQSFISQWFDLADEEHFWMHGRLKAVLTQFKNNKILTDKPLHGLEIGCGHGILRFQIEQHTNWTIDGTDLDLTSLENNPPCRGDVYLYNIFEKHASFKEHYDFIILYDVIEHINNVQPFLQACLFHIKRGGNIFINVPALQSLYSTYDRTVGHYRRYDKNMLSEELTQAGLQIIHQNYWGFLFLPLLWIRKLTLSRSTETNIIVKKGFSPQFPIVNLILKMLILCEIKLFPNPILGTSLMAIAIKKE
jgi:2-polyprenyl-3-methyl-5-hydroxy-6-metoxy-1,4-benzoquinol methylase